MWLLGVLLALGIWPALASGIPLARENPHPTLPLWKRGREVVTLAAVGDVMLARGVGRRVERRGVAYPLGNARRLLKADITFANLECVLTSQPVVSGRRYLLRADPGRVACLSGISIVSLANNHSLDCGEEGLNETKRVLTGRRIAWVEHGGWVLLARKGLKIGFLGLDDTGDAPLLEETVRSVVLGMRGRADVVVVAVHWGMEQTSRVTLRQVHLAHLMAQAGADLVLGSHPHVLQALEMYSRNGARRTLIAYSLGNFVFDGPGFETGVLRCTLSREGIVSAEVAPMVIEHCAPTPATGRKGRDILIGLARLCGQRSTAATVRLHPLRLEIGLAKPARIRASGTATRAPASR